MAVVRLSEQLKDDIRRAVARNYERQRAIVTKEQAQLHAPTISVREVYDMLVSPYTKELSGLSAGTLKAFTSSVRGADVRAVIGTINTNDGVVARTMTNTYNLALPNTSADESFVWPKQHIITQAKPEGVAFRSANNYRAEIDILIDVDHSVPATHQDTPVNKLRQWVLDYTGHDELTALHRQEKEALQSCDQLLSQYATLAPLLKVWPTLWELLSLDVRERHKRIVERKPRGIDDKEIPDMTNVTSIIIANKVQGSRGGDDNA